MKKWSIPHFFNRKTTKSSVDWIRESPFHTSMQGLSLSIPHSLSYIWLTLEEYQYRVFKRTERGIKEMKNDKCWEWVKKLFCALFGRQLAKVMERKDGRSRWRRDKKGEREREDRCEDSRHSVVVSLPFLSLLAVVEVDYYHSHSKDTHIHPQGIKLRYNAAMLRLTIKKEDIFVCQRPVSLWVYCMFFLGYLQRALDNLNLLVHLLMGLQLKMCESLSQVLSFLPRSPSIPIQSNLLFGIALWIYCFRGAMEKEEEEISQSGISSGRLRILYHNTLLISDALPISK